MTSSDSDDCDSVIHYDGDRIRGELACLCVHNYLSYIHNNTTVVYCAMHLTRYGWTDSEMSDMYIYIPYIYTRLFVHI